MIITSTGQNACAVIICINDIITQLIFFDHTLFALTCYEPPYWTQRTFLISHVMI